MIIFELIQPLQEDVATLCSWRNDPLSLKMSFTYTAPKTVETFFPEFIRNYFSLRNLPPLFAKLEGKRVGALRFDPSEDALYPSCEISLIVAPEKRNQGIGAAILQTIEPFLKRQGIAKVVARIKPENIASIKTFSRAGYAEVQGGSWLVFEKLLKEDQFERVFIIAEAGSNWKADHDSESLTRAFRMIDIAKSAGADAIKFQTFRAKDTYVPEAGKSDYLQESGIKEDIFALLESLEMSETMLQKIADHCIEAEIEFMSSAFSVETFVLINPLVKRHKIASYEISHLRLLECAAQSNKPVILSTGASKTSDIDWAVDTFFQAGSQNLTLMQCTAQYPASESAINLKVIPWLKSRYQLAVGLSDHSLHPFAAPIGAVALGATVIEKHFTLDRQLRGPDHAFAIEPDELKQLVLSIRSIEKMKGSGVKDIQSEEKELYFFARRGIQTLRDIRAGEILREGMNIAILRPGKKSLGLHPKYLEKVIGKCALRPIAKGEGVQLEDVEEI